MRSIPFILLGLVLGVPLFGQSPASGNAPGPFRTPDALDEIFAPIALYPDPLVALILTAATAPDDIARADAFLLANGDPAAIGGQAWDESVKSLTHYPTVLDWMNRSMAWTQQAGDAFYNQPGDVMKSIQQLRARAVAAGSLQSTPQQQVIMDDTGIRIVPVQPDVIYVPSYDPALVYSEQPEGSGPFLTFGAGYPEGVWLNYDLDWATYGIWIGGWHRGWDYRNPEWRRPGGEGGSSGGRAWRPDPGIRASIRSGGIGFGVEIARPAAAGFGGPGQPGAPGMGGRISPGSFQSHDPAQDRPELRGYSPPAGASTVLGGYGRGSETRAYSQRGQSSRQQAPVPRQRSSAPAPRPGSQGRSEESGHRRD